MGSDSEDAALKTFPKCETVPCHEFEDAFKVSMVVNVMVCWLKLAYLPTQRLYLNDYVALTEPLSILHLKFLMYVGSKVIY